MTGNEIYKKIFDEAFRYLRSFEGIDDDVISRHLNDWENTKPESILDLYTQMLVSISNKRNMKKTIGPIENIRPFLEDFSPKRIVERYDSDWEELFNTIKNNYDSPGRMEIDNPRSYWVIFCKSVISSSGFFSRFSNLEEFDNFVSQFYLNEYTRVALPLLLEKEIFGLGFILACDFLKENGYPKFIKPDTHTKKIFEGTGISDSDSDYNIFKDLIRFCEDIDELPYRVDKLFGLVGSGQFYLDEIKIDTDPDWFIEKINQKIENGIFEAENDTIKENTAYPVPDTVQEVDNPSPSKSILDKIRDATLKFLERFRR